jgi:hypothetical protein
MRFNKIIVFCLFLSCSAWGRGGDSIIVGNGAGLAENNIQFAYLSLKMLTTYCSDAPSLCRLDAKEAKTINDIQSVVRKNADKTDKIIFLKEEDFSRFSFSPQKRRLIITFLSVSIL